ncbi:MAG: GH3 auxin-responsive promoter family protein [Bacteroidales bacterium]|nr:GH3 auxin-responsive promoter family protein [Bacteroidales bacterium]MCF8326764.1 GH3 auxin-responsive promoter family protein [Bacteroidales bacterium]
MPLINSLISWFMKKRMHQIELFVRYPHNVQEEWFQRLIREARYTEWGLKYDYSGIKNREQFRERVPINTYDDLKPYIDRIRKGEQNILWNTDIRWFAKSSGTTAGKSKFIPVSTEAIEETHFRGGKDLLSFYCTNYPDTKLFDGKALGLGGSHYINEFDNESFYGDVSAIIIQNLPFWAEFSRTPNMDVALMDQWEEKIEKMAEITSKENVTNLAGVPSWGLILLHRILEKTGKSNILDVWPNFEAIFHGGVNFVPYRNQFEKISSPGINYIENYNASEGYFGIQDQKNSNELLLMLDYGIYYEFMPISEIEKENPKTLTLEEVETGVNYALIISTNAGLWRYMIGDTIRFTSKNPYRIQITGRTKHFINAFGEELIVENAENALDVACQKTGSIIKEYTAAPVYLGDNQQAAHEWIIEFEKQPENFNFFKEALDNALKAINSDYEAKRYNDLMLQAPIIHSVEQGTFYNWMKKRGKLGGQNKVPRLSNNRDYVDEIKKMM